MSLSNPRTWPVVPPGKRGEVLLLLGVAWILVGVGTFLIPPAPGDVLLAQVLPSVAVRGGLWIVTGLVALVYAWTPRRRSDAVGFLALYVMPVARAVSNLVAWATWLTDGDAGGGYRYGWLSAAFYLVFAGIVGICAGWRENQTVRPTRGGRR